MSQDKNTQNKKTKCLPNRSSRSLNYSAGAFICRDAFCGDLRQLRQPRAIRHLPASHRGHPSSHLDLHLDVWKADKPLHLRRLPSGRKGERK